MIVKRKLKLEPLTPARTPDHGWAKKSPLVETSGLRYLDLISVLFGSDCARSGCYFMIGLCPDQGCKDRD